jgi:hypothetical protein
MLHWLIRQFIGRIAAIPVRRRLRAFERATTQPEPVQRELLHRILTTQANTDFGRRHHFQSIKSVSDFRRQLPVATYEYFEPYIERMRRGETRALLTDKKIHMFAMTSGTTAARKYIPVTDQYLADYRRGWNLWGLKVFRDHPEVRLRPIVQLSGDWQEFFTESGIPCGSVTGLTATMQLRIVRWLYLVPASLGKVKDPLAKHYLTLRLSMPRHPGMIIAANPSTLVNLARFGDQEKEALIRDIYDGTLSNRFDIPAPVRDGDKNAVALQYKERAKELEQIAQRSGTLYPKDYWPKDVIIGNWMGGSVGAYLRHYPKYYGNTPVRDVGLIASEGRMTIPVSDGTPSGILDVTTQYFEFIPEGEIDSAQPTILGAHELEVGKTYYILLTTSYGLYRYNIFDVVRCTGYFNKTPLVEFLSKGSLFANLTGEKLSEYHVTGAMSTVQRDLNLNLTAYSVAPCWDDEQPYYGLFIERGDLGRREQGEALIHALEKRLQEVNIEYAAKRESRRLGPLRLNVIPNQAWQEWDRQRLAHSGGTLEQYKHPCLIPDLQFRAGMRIEEEIQPAL